MRILRNGLRPDERAVTDEERRAFRRFYGWRGRGGTDWAVAEPVWAYIHRRFVLECDCRDDGHQPVIVAVGPDRVRVGTEIRPVRHAVDCPFYRDPPSAAEYDRSYRRPRRTDNFTFLTAPGRRHAPAPMGAEADAPPDTEDEALAEVRHGRAGRRPKLAQLLFALVADAGLDTQAVGQPADRAPLLHIRRAAAGYRIVPGRSVAGHLCTNAGYVRAIQDRLRREAGEWPAGIEPQGIYIGIADRIRDNVLFLDRFGDRVRVQCRIATFGEPEGRWDRPPYYVIAVFSRETEGDGTPVFHRAYAHPVHSAALGMPVDSHFERRTLDILLGEGREALRRVPSGRVMVTKPLFDLPVRMEDGARATCRPDFLLTFDDWPSAWGNRLVVETMGSGAVDYRDAKDVSHTRMARIGPIVTHEPWRDGERGAAGIDRDFIGGLVREAMRLRRARPPRPAAGA